MSSKAAWFTACIDLKWEEFPSPHLLLEEPNEKAANHLLKLSKQLKPAVNTYRSQYIIVFVYLLCGALASPLPGI